MTGLFVSLFLALAAAAQEAPAAPQKEAAKAAPRKPEKRRIRFIDNTAEMCEIVSADEEGITVRLNQIPEPVKFRWWQINSEEAEALQERYQLKASIPSPGTGQVSGVRIRTEHATYEGVLVPGAPPGEIWVQNVEGRFVIPFTSVLERDEIALDLVRIYKPDEIHAFFSDKIRPQMPDDYDRLAMALIQAKLGDRAAVTFRLADLLRNPSWPEARAFQALVRLREKIEEVSLKRRVFDAQESYLSADYDAVLARLEELDKDLEKMPPDGKLRADVSGIRAEIHEFRRVGREEQIVQDCQRTMDAQLRVKALDRAVSFAEAKAYVEDRLMKETFAEVARRFNFSPEDTAVEIVWERRPATMLFKHGYGSGSWMAARPELRNPEDWWSKADGTSRYNVLKGLAAEKHREVLRTEVKSCPVCAGRGTVEPIKFPDAVGGICPSCLGIKTHRVLIYR